MPASKRRIAPRLANGHHRAPRGLNLPPAVNDGLRELAARECRSVSWIMEEVIIDYFGLRRLACRKADVRYKTPSKA
jgi:predicted transcriptional regulator